ncbi:MAG: RNA pseudouridine synthase [Rhodoferax sp.]|uniref:RluA family pseudouridine synthase n=1 Tax=Rhodoferax sp. TaxID=50421 RepID=UPI00185548B8|nr:pseudouridine synthase [Rhodoferax sp.]NMM15143.1 RNA pseudouridine synthase [Rhodoferax sp.]
MHPAELTILYADEAILVLDKPAGLLSVPGRGEDKQDCLSARAQRLHPDALIVHRLDMATSGVMVLARGAAAQRSLNDAFASRTVTKRYIAVVAGHLAPPAESWGVIDLPIIVDWPNRPRRIIDHQLGKPSVTRWRVLSHDTDLDTTRVELEPVTGRSHQLRVHLLAVGHGIAGDALYGSPRVLALADRLLLHACSLELPHPVTAEVMRFTSSANF